ncbi:hypothetical protein BGW80DRAFT_1333111 [Lactifluus volemus]|nr:hypothetical protein BGW80DRAFT_1333111 [Lactifluus volemus]
MGLLTWFKKKQPEDFGQILASFAHDIQKRETRLNEIRLRERRATLLVTMYTFAGWGAYLGLWYAQLLPWMTKYRTNSEVEKAIKGFLVILGPIIILFSRRIVQLWFNRKGSAEEKSLAALKLARRKKVQEIKKMTNYDETRELLERYEDGPKGGRVVSPSTSALPVTPQRAVSAVPANTPANLRTPISPGLESQLAQPSQQPLPPPRKLWYDKLADALLGDDEPVNAVASRYALICQKCFAHNGLVKEEMWEDAQYVCPKCGHFNPSARSQRNITRNTQTPPQPTMRSTSPKSVSGPPNSVDGSPTT